ncbi:MAG: hypothetical protein LBM98_08285 [Oscillospiraceae bacterium]|nr:hypothetical protein [Oscillospiraceae bacterium]
MEGRTRATPRKARGYVPAHCAGTGLGFALPVFAKPPPHLRYVLLKRGEAIQG